MVELSIFYDFLNCGKYGQKRRHFGSSPSDNLFLENGVSDVNSRTDFPAITVKSTHFLQPADLLSLSLLNQKRAKQNPLADENISTSSAVVTVVSFLKMAGEIV